MRRRLKASREFCIWLCALLCLYSVLLGRTFHFIAEASPGLALVMMLPAVPTGMLGFAFAPNLAERGIVRYVKDKADQAIDVALALATLAACGASAVRLGKLRSRRERMALSVLLAFTAALALGALGWAWMRAG